MNTKRCLPFCLLLCGLLLLSAPAWSDDVFTAGGAVCCETATGCENVDTPEDCPRGTTSWLLTGTCHEGTCHATATPDPFRPAAQVAPIKGGAVCCETKDSCENVDEPEDCPDGTVNWYLTGFCDENNKCQPSADGGDIRPGFLGTVGDKAFCSMEK